MTNEQLEDLDRQFPDHFRIGSNDWFNWHLAFEAGKRDRYTGDSADTCTCDGCRV